ncbi:hypothetical protein EZ449_21440 [Pedobacter frigidisoli]|uniref:Outer membrane protein beta-barrel domain-containing protein n=1 Tax=Pedobacter frigidisoli TaxID=2530455 RepID=A0A4R0NIH0_9SPHI|nr:hypothetical protein [Pedobacter frigidisoli]TCC99093.1 hypothetical protein EZ449_21440 [Pedobacter frigidisoli]
MKRSIQLSTIVFGLFFCFSHALAQDKRTSEIGVEKRTNALEIGVEYLKGLGDFGDIYDNGIGGAVRYRFGVTEHKSLLASVGYMNFMGNLALPGNNKAVDLNARFIPIKIGMKFRFLKYVYVAGEIGGTIALGVKGVENINSFVASQYEIKGTLFNYTPTIGVQIPTTGKNYVDLGIRYEGMIIDQRSTSFFGIRAAYAFDVAR